MEYGVWLRLYLRLRLRLLAPFSYKLYLFSLALLEHFTFTSFRISLGYAEGALRYCHWRVRDIKGDSEVSKLRAQVKGWWKIRNSLDIVREGNKGGNSQLKGRIQRLERDYLIRCNN